MSAPDQTAARDAAAISAARRAGVGDRRRETGNRKQNLGDVLVTGPSIAKDHNANSVRTEFGSPETRVCCVIIARIRVLT
jgi:hypothetical protein